MGLLGHNPLQELKLPYVTIPSQNEISVRIVSISTSVSRQQNISNGTQS